MKPTLHLSALQSEVADGLRAEHITVYDDTSSAAFPFNFNLVQFHPSVFRHVSPPVSHRLFSGTKAYYKDAASH